MQEVFASNLVELGSKYQNLVVLNGNCEQYLGEFASHFSERNFNLGLAESNMVGASCGFAALGKVPFVVGNSAFLIGKAWQQIRNDLCYPNLNVKIIGFGAGFDNGPEGAAMQCFEDIALMRSLPNMKVVVPSGPREVAGAMEAMMRDFGPTYLRLSSVSAGVLGHAASHGTRAPHSRLETADFQFGRGVVVRDGSDICLFTCGKMVRRCLQVAKMLAREGIEARVVNLASVKPLDVQLVERCGKEIEKCVVVEEHSVIGGLGAAVAEVLGKKVMRIGVADTFGESGRVELLERKYGLDVESVFEKVRGAC